jgi:hypothetical protein
MTLYGSLIVYSTDTYSEHCTPQILMATLPYHPGYQTPTASRDDTRADMEKVMY